MKRTEKTRYQSFNFLLIGLVLTFSFSSIEKEDLELFELEGSIVGFDYCSFHSNGRVGYVIISNDFTDSFRLTAYHQPVLGFRLQLDSIPAEPFLRFQMRHFTKQV